MKNIPRFILFLALLIVTSCNDSKESLELIVDEPDRKTLPVDKLGMNAFAADPSFGSPEAQFQEIQNELGIPYVRILMNWNDAVQPSPGASLNMSFYDELVSSLPPGMRAFIVLADLPSWFHNSQNWKGENERLSYVEQWVMPVVLRYSNSQKIVGFQIWNEPNNAANSQNAFLGVLDNPEQYVELLASSYSLIKDIAPNKLVINAATLPLQQNFPKNLEYNEAMRDAGALAFLDVYAFHFYSAQYEKFVQGPRDFLNGLGKPLWVTESGIQGVNKQLEYGERAWPWLLKELPSLQRIFVYQFAEQGSPDSSFGLKNGSPDQGVSDLYLKLRELRT